MRRKRFPFQRADEPARPIDGFDYSAPAEIFMTRGGFTRGGPSMTYRRFPSAAAAIRFAIEEIPTSALLRATMEVLEKRFDHRAIRNLYENDAYPSVRTGKAEAGTAPTYLDTTKPNDSRTGHGAL